VLICRDLLDPAVVSALAELRVRVVLAPAWSHKTEAFAAHAGQLATDAQALTLVANLPADRDGFSDGRCLPVIAAVPRRGGRVVLPSPPLLPAGAFVGVVQIRDKNGLSFHCADG
ncbi:MAG: hypothetical protein U0324_46840, partial [Polyangiales bacterium]